ncbi:PREDICTED: N-glycosylase/DNA lyase OGG1 [Nicotiana attenuata]|uniref:DNA-(apurinic or apyrimidinic site) lyase n=1 Tax=Nicotiana attenuata TaxID=49451 RepID=A0A1J6L0A2_NICAT|nr:PREDICTED: N-glycosylase/DNA lyase OGG1 [Nicotiana attenuata]OIT27279.1 n-glycosylasedna lyase ogg1 [Nicotiana attenuata]
MQALRTCPIMKRPRTIPSAPSTPPSPQIIQSKKTPTSRSFSSIKPRNILINPTPTTEQDPKWVPLNLSRSELYLPLTFPTGQTFRWKQTAPIQYTGVVGRSHLVSLKQLDNGDVGYHFHCTNSKAAASREEALVDFLNVGISLSEVWESFKASDSRFAELATHLEGARVLRQDPLECLIQFICSSNNNIKRITMMVDFVSSLGNYLGDVGGFKFYEFPSLERLAMVSEQELRAAGFGYRAKYIVGTVEALQSKPGGGTEWLAALRKVDLPEAIDALCSLPGVGPKVAACISLFSLDQHHAIPVDTHVWKIATKYLLPELAGTSLTPKLSSRVADAFVKTYGKYAGWAQTLLFIAELPSQKALLTSSLLNSTVEKSPKSKKRKQGGITEIPIG